MFPVIKCLVCPCDGDEPTRRVDESTWTDLIGSISAKPEIGEFLPRAQNLKLFKLEAANINSLNVQDLCRSLKKCANNLPAEEGDPYVTYDTKIHALRKHGDGNSIFLVTQRTT